MAHVSAIITAAGTAQRMQSKQNKAFLKVLDESVIRRTCQAFLAHPRIGELFVMAHPEELAQMRRHLANLSSDDRIKVVPGGKTRQESVLLGLRYLAQNRPAPLDRLIVLVHDGARCLVSAEIIDRCIDQIELLRCGAGAAVPVTDTIRMINRDNFVSETPDRDRLVAMQTPQGADMEVLLAAYEEAEMRDVQATDDLAVLEEVGYPVRLVDGHPFNLKITHPHDIILAEQLLLRKS